MKLWICVVLIIYSVHKAICELEGNYINFLDTAIQSKHKIQFYDYWNFAVVMGCIDGCHILIEYPFIPLV